MLLYTPLSQQAAERVAAGLGFGAGVLHFVDRPDVDAAEADAVWIVLDAPEDAVRALEISPHPGLGYREFAIPASIADRYRAERADVGGPCRSK